MTDIFLASFLSLLMVRFSFIQIYFQSIFLLAGVSIVTCLFEYSNFPSSGTMPSVCLIIFIALLISDIIKVERGHRRHPIYHLSIVEILASEFDEL